MNENICGFTGICDNETPCQNPEYQHTGFCLQHLEQREVLESERRELECLNLK